jgi:hypothetical protein
LWGFAEKMIVGAGQGDDCSFGAKLAGTIAGWWRGSEMALVVEDEDRNNAGKEGGDDEREAMDHCAIAHMRNIVIHRDVMNDRNFVADGQIVLARHHYVCQ